jgi:hypothetical protein
MEKKREKEICEIMDGFIDSLSKKESGVILYCNDESDFKYSTFISIKEVAMTVATLFDDYYDDGDEKSKPIVEGILLGLAGLIHEHGKSGRMIVDIVMEATLSSAKEMLKKITDGIDDEDYKDCSKCKKANTCRAPHAVEYRKKNGIKGFRAAIMEFLTQQNITVV